ncbi:MAG TPA: hypothetical protein VFT46_12245 [Holophagaceae bacterium]|nr:hypothetical protein [Holophagaceae bacterium]
MKSALALVLFCCCALAGRVDRLSGPSRTTVQELSWGTIYFEPSRLGDCELTRIPGGFKLASPEGEVLIQGSEASGFRLSCGQDVLELRPVNGGGGVEVRGQGRAWSLRISNGTVTLVSSSPRDTVVFRRSANPILIEGSRGKVSIVSEGGDLRISSPLGVTEVGDSPGGRTFHGPALDRIPYLGRGIFIPFHGAGVFLDLRRAFPLPETAEWADWRDLLLQP